MCGFLCVVTRAPLTEAIDLGRLDGDVLRHRGPDSSGEIVFPHAYVRHWRLSVVDLSQGSSQPYGSGDSRLIYNGEIYNYEELAARSSLQVSGDTPLLYELCRHGVERRELVWARGFYSYLYLTENGLRLSGGRDPFGKKPLFYHVDDAAGIAVFASEEKAIVDCLAARRIDFSAVAQYLLYKQVFHGQTFFSDIAQLAPGAWFEFDVRRWAFSVDRSWSDYYELPSAEVFALQPRADVREALDARRLDALVAAELSASVSLRIPREVSACVALSGGVDSALIADSVIQLSLLEHLSQFVTVGFEEPGCDESTRAVAIADALSVAGLHAIVPFPQQEFVSLLTRCIEAASAPLEHPHYLSYYVLCRYAATLSKVLITGEGADELFMGYEHYRAAGASFAFREYLLRDDESSFTSGGAGLAFDGIRRDAGIGPLRSRAVSSRFQSRDGELKSHLLTLLARNDKMGMVNSVEIRAPFLDRRIMEVAMAMSDADLVVNGAPKQVLKQLFASAFPHTAPQEEKIGFRVPFDEMFLAGRDRGPLRDYCELAARALRAECGLQLRSAESISARLGWSLLNVGVFLDTHGYTS